MEKKKLVVFTGAGVSADSGISTFRDADGLWENYRIEDVCTPEALVRNRNMVIEFYNARRKDLLGRQPNEGHYAIAELEKHFDVDVITQNIDDLHERAGSSRITHLHGELRKLRSSRDETLTFPIEGWEQKPGDMAPDGTPARSSYFSGKGFRCSTGRHGSQPQPTCLSSWALRWPSIRQRRWCGTSVPRFLSMWSIPTNRMFPASAIR